MGAILAAILGASLLDCHEAAKEPRSIVVVVPDAAVAQWVKAALPRVQIRILRVSDHEPAAVVRARAWAYREADYFFFDPDSNSTELTILRERLGNQGVVPVNLRPHLLAIEGGSGNVTTTPTLLSSRQNSTR